MRRGRIGGPFKRVGMPRIRRSLRAAEHAYEKVHQERDLPGYYDQQADGCNHVQRLERLVVGINLQHVDSALAAAQADKEERNKNQVEADPGEDEVHFSPGLIHHPAEHLREPVIDPAKSCDDRGRYESVVEMRDYKIAVVQIDVGRVRPQRNAGYAAE